MINSSNCIYDKKNKADGISAAVYRQSADRITLICSDDDANATIFIKNYPGDMIAKAVADGEAFLTGEIAAKRGV